MAETRRPIIDVVIPAFNELEALPLVLADIPRDWVRDIIVVDNNSNDGTADAARKGGAIAVLEPKKGYGAACLRGIATVAENHIPPDILVFMDADYSDHPEELPLLVKPIIDGQVSFVIGSRELGVREKGAMMPQQIFGNWLATFLLRRIYGATFTDLGPFRAITWKALQSLNMQDKDFGWTVEMQVKVLKMKVPYVEMPVSYRRRKGVSKITGTLKGSVMAGYKIIQTIFKYA